LAEKPTGNAMFSKARLDTLSDGIFGVAMTLLILDVRLPDDFHPADGAELLQGLGGLWPKFLPYVLSFGVSDCAGFRISRCAAAPNTSTANSSIGGCSISS
jgi:hypothetical protein